MKLIFFGAGMNGLCGNTKFTECVCEERWLSVLGRLWCLMGGGFGRKTVFFAATELMEDFLVIFRKG